MNGNSFQPHFGFHKLPEMAIFRVVAICINTFDLVPMLSHYVLKKYFIILISFCQKFFQFGTFLMSVLSKF